MPLSPHGSKCAGLILPTQPQVEVACEVLVAIFYLPGGAGKKGIRGLLRLTIELHLLNGELDEWMLRPLREAAEHHEHVGLGRHVIISCIQARNGHVVSVHFGPG